VKQRPSATASDRFCLPSPDASFASPGCSCYVNIHTHCWWLHTLQFTPPVALDHAVTGFQDMMSSPSTQVAALPRRLHATCTQTPCACMTSLCLAGHQMQNACGMSNVRHSDTPDWVGLLERSWCSAHKGCMSHADGQWCQRRVLHISLCQQGNFLTGNAIANSNMPPGKRCMFPTSTHRHLS
jgi:hypothetical protein